MLSDQDEAREKLYTKKGQDEGMFMILSWSKTDLINWAKDYSNLPESIIHGQYEFGDIEN